MGGFAFRGSPASGRTEIAALLVSPKWRLETWVALVRRLWSSVSRPGSRGTACPRVSLLRCRVLLFQRRNEAPARSPTSCSPWAGFLSRF